MRLKQELNANQYYFPDRLRQKLTLLSQYPVTVVEAPSGFGKTTAVREHLSSLSSHRLVWYTCFGESPGKAWGSIISLLEQIGVSMSSEHAMHAGGLSNGPSILNTANDSNDYYLVIDNFQLIDTEIPGEVAEAFFRRSEPSLHLVFITQQLGAEGRVLLDDPRVHTINAESFFFGKEDIVAYLHLSGLRIRSDELDSLYRSTEGWISAIRLQMMSYRETGVFSGSHGIDRLIETAIWSHIDDGQRTCLLSLSLLDSFTQQQAEILSAGQSANISHLLGGNTFIRSYTNRNSFYIHGVLREYLQNRFAGLAQETRLAILEQVGESCVATGQIALAARFYYQAGNLDAVLRLPYYRAPFFFPKDQEFIDFIYRLVTECPDEQLAEAPDTLLAFACLLVISGYPDEYQRLCGILEDAMRDSPSPAEGDSLAGDFALLRSIDCADDIAQLHAHHIRAAAALGHRPSRLFRHIPWLYGGVSMLQLLWHHPGRLRDTIRAVQEHLPLYLTLTDGQGAGADLALEAEAALLCGEGKVAESLCHKAIYLAEAQRQDSVCFCAELLLARAALYHGSADDFHVALERMQRRGLSESANQQMLDLCRGFLGITLGDERDVPEWLKNPDAIRKALYTPVFPYGMIIYGRWLLIRKMYYALYGIAAIVLDASELLSSLLPKVYMYLYLAQAKYTQGQAEPALHYLKEALDIALPDRIYLPFAEQEDSLFELIQCLLQRGYPRGRELARIVRRRQQQLEGMKQIRRSLRLSRPTLTKREAEIVSLAKKGLTNRQISERLSISHETVKSTLRGIYGKLGIHSKAQLSEVEYDFRT